MDDAPAPPHPEIAPPKPKSKCALVIGFIVGAVPWIISAIPQRDYRQIGWVVVSCFGVPIVAIVLAIIPRTRRGGLGMLLACGLGWLVLGALCGGLIK